MVNIDYIFELLDWNNNSEKQNIGIQLANSVKCISVFLQPGWPYGKNVWDNCASILAKKSDKELKPYLIQLLEWLQDVNWPGSSCIAYRLQNYADTQSFEMALTICKNKAHVLNDEEWERNLNILEDKRKIAQGTVCVNPNEK